MRRQRHGYAIGASLVGFALLLTAPGVGAAQEVRSGVSADTPLSYHLSALSSSSVFTRGGIWVRHEGMWAFRPTRFYQDPQAYFFWSWQLYGYSGWDLAPGGWLWFPGQRYANNRAWDLFQDLWSFRPANGFGSHGLGYGSNIPSFLLSGPTSGRTLAEDLAHAYSQIQPHRWDLRQDAARIAEHWRTLRHEQQAPESRPDESRRFDPVRQLPFVPQASESSGSGSPDPAARTAPSIDRAQIGPRVDTPASASAPRITRQSTRDKAGDPADRSRSRPATTAATKNPSFPRAPASKAPKTASPKVEKHKSPRTPAKGTSATGPAKSKQPTSRPSRPERVKPPKKTDSGKQQAQSADRPTAALL